MISKFLLPGDDRELFFFLNTMITVVSHRDHFKTSSKSWSHCWWLFQNVNQRPQVHVHLKQCSPVSPLTEMFAWSLLSLSSVWRWRSCEGTRWPGPPCGCARAARPWCGGGGPGQHPARTIDRVCKKTDFLRAMLGDYVFGPLWAIQAILYYLGQFGLLWPNNLDPQQSPQNSARTFFGDS